MAELTDRELLERAAKAAGYSVAHGCDGAPVVAFIDGDPRDWNPLESDGDALRLAVKLHISIRHPNPLDLGGGYVTASICAYRHRYKFPKKTDFSVILGSEECPNDLLVATRRAIVRAAASLATEGGV